MALVCTSQDLQGIPVECRNGNDFVLMRGIFFFLPGFSFADKAAAGDINNWKQGVIDGNILPVHGVKELEDMSGEDVRYESPGQDKKELFEGKRGFMASFDLTLDQHKVLRQYSGKGLKIAWYDRNNNIYMYSPDGTQVEGFDLDFLDIPKQGMPTADTPLWSNVEVQLAEASQWDDFGAVIRTNRGTAADRWLPSQVDSLTTVLVTQVGSIVTDTVTFDVQYKSVSETDVDGTELTISNVTDMDVTTYTNFQFTVGGTVTAPSAMTDEGDGRYTATVSGIATADTIKILPTLEAAPVNENFVTSEETAVTS